MTPHSALHIQERLAAGGMGEVWRGSTADGVPVAVKVLRVEQGVDPRVRALFDGEVRAMARLAHPHISWVYDYGSVPEAWSRQGESLVPGARFVAMEFSSGGTLEDQPPATWGATRDVLLRLLDALAHAHARGIVHRDLKPANVLISEAGDVRPGIKLTDFGVAHAIGASSRRFVAGTPEYMAPEQARGRPSALGPWTDLYALGCMAWEWVCGQLPARDPDGKLPAYRPQMSVPAGVEAWIRELLAVDPAERTRCAADALHGLTRLAVDGLDVPPELALEGLPPMPEAWRAPQHPTLRLHGAGLGLLGLREVGLVGREAERTQLWAQLRRVRTTGVGEVAVVRGVSGVGKTALVRWLGQRAHEVGAADVVHVACERGESPEAGFRKLVVRLLRLVDVPESKRLLALDEALEAHEVRPRHHEMVRALLAGTAGAERWGRAPCIRGVCRGRARRRGLLLVIDDAQWGPEQLELVRMLQRAQRLRATPVLVVVVVEEESLAHEPEAAELLEGLAEAGGEVLPLLPLPETDQAQLLREVLGLDPHLLAEAATRCGGNPGFAMALVGHWVAQGNVRPGAHGFRHREGVELAMPSSLAELWRQRLESLVLGLDDRSRRALELAAVLGASVDEALWAQVCDDPDASWARKGVSAVDPRGHRLRQALVERLLLARLAEETDEGFAFTHRMIVEVLVDQAGGAGTLQAHHRACAAHLAVRSSADDAYALGRHLMGAGEPHAAAEPLLRGMQRLMAYGDSRTVLADIQRLRVQLGPELEAGRVTALLGALEAHALQVDGQLELALVCAQRAVGEARQVGDREAAAHALARVADLQMLLKRLDEVEVTSRALLEVIDACSHPHWGTLAQIRLARACRERGDLDGMRAWCHAATDGLESGLDRPETSVMLAAAHDILRDDLQTKRWALVAWRVNEAAGHTIDAVWAAAKLHELALRSGDRHGARRWLRAAIDQAVLGAEMRNLAILRFNLAKIDLADGCWEAARDGLARAADEGPGDPLTAALFRVGSAAATAGLGDWGRHDHHMARLSLGSEVPRVPDFVEVLDIALGIARQGSHPQRVARLEAARAALA